MLKMAVYSEANAILGSSLSPSNYCICKATAIANGANASRIELIVANAASNRLIPVSALLTSVVTYTIRFLDWDGTVLKTEQVTSGSNPTPPSNPTRTGYTFSGWSPTVGVANQNQDYTATYTENAPAVQYHITFAEGKQYNLGFYFYMNNGTFVPIANSSSINASDVQYVAYLSSNASESFLIDNTESNSIAYTDDANSYLSYSQNVYTHRSAGYSAVTTYMLNSDVVTYCSGTFNGSGQVPSVQQLYKMLDNINSLNTALSFIGATSIKTNTNIGNDSDNWYYEMNNKYWSREADGDISNNRYGMIWCGGYYIQIPKLEIDPETHLPVTTYIQTPLSYSDPAYNLSILAAVRAVKPINVQAPASATGIYSQYDVNPGTTPSTSNPTKTDYTFTGWDPTPYPADKDEIYVAQWTENSSGGGDDPSNPYTITCEGVANGGTVYVDVHLTSVDISWSGPSTIDQQWDVRGGGSGGSAQAGYHSWGSGYVNNLNFTSTTTIQQGGYVSYTVTGVHTASGNYSISGYWPVVVVESH